MSKYEGENARNVLIRWKDSLVPVGGRSMGDLLWSKDSSLEVAGKKYKVQPHKPAMLLNGSMHVLEDGLGENAQKLIERVLVEGIRDPANGKLTEPSESKGGKGETPGHWPVENQVPSPVCGESHEDMCPQVSGCNLPSKSGMLLCIEAGGSEGDGKGKQTGPL